jgi:aspartate ammonia-lyase
MSLRIDRDSLGEVKVPSDAYYGPFTARAINQYKVSGQPAHINLIRAYAMIKKSAALANTELGVLDPKKGDAITQACDEILNGRLSDQFKVEAINSGAGTAFNMNCNEVIANRALEIIGEQKGKYDVISPNDDVNKSQSSNDTFPTAMNVAILLNLRETNAAIDKLIASLDRKAKEFADVAKIGRTHLMDAIPVTLGARVSVGSGSAARPLEPAPMRPKATEKGRSGIWLKSQDWIWFLQKICFILFRVSLTLRVALLRFVT